MMIPFHSGEQAVQARAGVQAMAERVGRSIHSSLPPAAQEFLQEQRMAVISTVSADGRVWTSLLTGSAGFMRALDERRVQIGAGPAQGDPARDNLRNGGPVGLIAVEFTTRRRMRLNGWAEPLPGGGLLVHVRQAYANCPKYIQARTFEEPVSATDGAGAGEAVQRSMSLSEEQRRWITAADTFFIGSFHLEGGADASHRGGNPGFVRVVSEAMLEFPDYAGNMMFNTLGNLAENPNAGLLFLDFQAGRTLQMVGQARVVWDLARVAAHAGAERVVEFQVEHVIERAAVFPWRLRLVDNSRFNP